MFPTRCADKQVKQKNSIKTMKNYNTMLADERPEYKAMNYGFDNLSNTELLSMVINRGAGTAESMRQARQLMNMVDNSLSKLARLSMYDLQVVQGVGDCKALAILAALELAKRKTMEKGSQRPDMGSSLAIYNYLQPMIGDLQVEQAHVILMNQNFKMLKHVKLSEGGLTETAVDVRLIIKEAVQCNATIVALAHNHPSGNTKPSRQDDVLTLNVKKACEVMRLFFMDHIIVTDGAYYSYHDNGKL